MTTKSPIRMEPDALQMVDWLAAMQTGQHLLDYSPTGYVSTASQWTTSFPIMKTLRERVSMPPNVVQCR
jgi:hypothetical protein